MLPDMSLSSIPSFSTKAIASDDKLRGGYYTPEPIARFIASWVSVAGDRLLEPSCGDGAILRYLSLQRESELLGIELNADEARKASTYAKVIHDDLFHWMESNLTTWDGVAGNPPYIRFGNWSAESRDRALKYLEKSGLRASRLTNAWVPFVVAATRLARLGGRVALVLPAELLQVGYAAQLRGFIVDNYIDVTIVTFRQLVFEGVLQEVVLFLGIRGNGPASMRTVHLNNLADLPHAELNGHSASALIHETEKWTKYFLTPRELATLRQAMAAPGVAKLGAVAEVQVGVVTGRNSFFTLTPSQAEASGISPLCVPLVARTQQLRGLQYTRDDFQSDQAADLRCWLLNASANDKSFLPLRKYVKEGEAQDVHLGYKCSIRSPWWTVPSPWVPDGFMFRQIHDHPRIVVNRSLATSTDTVHRVKLRTRVSMNRLAASAFTSLTFASAEVLGRSYGGGILEIEPGEALGLPIVALEHVPPSLSSRIDKLLRQGRLEDALDLSDGLLLRDALGWSASRIKTLRGAWNSLRTRRSERGRTF